MQKLLVEFKNASGNVHQAPCSVSGRVLNREKSLSAPHIVLADNSSDEDQHSDKSEQDLRVSVINMQNQLIPDSAKNSEQVKIPAGLDWINTLFLLYHSKKGEIGQFLLSLKEVGIFA
ncbi:MAG TPA: hypothetical protein ENI78_01960 [Euryarchaeota archaeon]|nr:hypothetical protein [Euryarchaeota archaeon]